MADELTAELGQLAEFVAQQAPEVREAFQFCIAVAMEKNRRARLVNTAQVSGEHQSLSGSRRLSPSGELSDMTSPIPEEASSYGFVLDALGSHSSRTMMLSELRLLLASCAPTADIQGYRSAIVDENTLLKETGSTRRKSYRHLRELYGLDRSVVLFRALRDLWDQDTQGQPLLALLCAIARDPSLRATTQVIFDAPASSFVTSDMMAKAVEEKYPGRLMASTVAKIGRNTASSWTQSGHLVGRTGKVRAMVQSHPIAVAYALLLGHLCDVRGEALFHTLWAKVLDAPVHTLQEHAIQASQQGWLEYRQSGAVTEITFDYLLQDVDEQEPGT